MNPRIGRRSLYNKLEKKPKPAVVEFVERNTKKNITMKQEFLYLEDVKTAINIQHLELHIRLKRWLIGQMKTKPSHGKLITTLEKSVEQDRHRLQKKFKINL